METTPKRKRYGIDGMRTYMQRSRTIPLLTPEEEAELGRRCMTGDMAARHELVNRNLRLVIAVVERYCWKYLKGHMEDILAEGNSGLFRATRDFDPSRARFSTFAVPWIRQRIARYLSQRRSAIRVPEHMYQLRARVRRGAKLTPNESLVWSRYGRFCHMGSVSMQSMPPEEYDKLFVAEEEQSPYHEGHHEIVNAHLGWLSARDREIVVEKLSNDVTLEALGKRHGISRERVRQIVGRFVEDVRKDARIRERTGQPLGRIAS